jgi:hypothetical protein
MGQGVMDQGVAQAEFVLADFAHAFVEFDFVGVGIMSRHTSASLCGASGSHTFFKEAAGCGAKPPQPALSLKCFHSPRVPAFPNTRSSLMSFPLFGGSTCIGYCPQLRKKRFDLAC